MTGPFFCETTVLQWQSLLHPVRNDYSKTCRLSNKWFLCVLYHYRAWNNGQTLDNFWPFLDLDQANLFWSTKLCKHGNVTNHNARYNHEQKEQRWYTSYFVSDTLDIFWHFVRSILLWSIKPSKCSNVTTIMRDIQNNHERRWYVSYFVLYMYMYLQFWNS